MDGNLKQQKVVISIPAHSNKSLKKGLLKAVIKN